MRGDDFGLLFVGGFVEVQAEGEAGWCQVMSRRMVVRTAMPVMMSA